MAALKYIATVHDVSVKVGEKEKLVRKGEAVPDGIHEAQRDALVRMGLLTATESPVRGSADDTATSPAVKVIVFDSSKLPEDGDNRDVWEAWGAEVVQLTADEAKTFKKKDELVAEVTTRFGKLNPA